MNRPIDDLQLIAPLKKLAKVPQATLGGVACFFVKNGAIISSGVNYNPTGEPMEHVVDGKIATRPEVVHAEVAAIKLATENGVDLTGSTLLVTMSPCINCAPEIAKTGIRDMKYLYEWWDKASFEILHDANINTQQIKEDK